MSTSKVKTYLGHRATALFHSNPEERERRKQTASLEQIARETINSTYQEDDPSVAEWFQGLVPSSAGVAEYIRELFPSAQWLRRYNVHWLTGDIVAGAFLNEHTSNIKLIE
jgi:sodium-independent sulfate anion transporter 11